MAIEHHDYPYLYFTGVNRAVNPYLMKDDELWDSVNFWTERTLGAKKVRPGLTLFQNQVDSNPVTGLFYVKFPNGQKRLARMSGNKIYAIDPTSASTWGSVILTASGGGNWNRPDFTVLGAKGHIVDQISDSVSHYVEWTNASGTDAMTEPAYNSAANPVVPYKAKTCIEYHNRVYVGSPYDASGVYKSFISLSTLRYDKPSQMVQPPSATPDAPWASQTVADQTDMTDIRLAWNLPIDKDYKGGILKLTNINDRVNIYKEEGVYRYNEQQVFSLFGLAPVPNSIATMPETQEDYFLTNEGFFKTNGQQTTPISDGWYPIIKQIFKNGITLSKINSFSANFLYFCYLGNVTYDGQTITKAMFVFNAKYQELSLWSMGVEITAMGYYVNNSSDKIIVMGDTNGKTYTLDYNANTDNGTTIAAYMKTKYFFFDSVVNKNQIDQTHALATLGSEMEVLIDTDFKGEYKDYFTIDDIHSKSRADFSKFGQFYVLSFKITWNGKGTRPELYGTIPKVVQTGTRFPDKAR